MASSTAQALPQPVGPLALLRASNRARKHLRKRFWGLGVGASADVHFGNGHNIADDAPAESVKHHTQSVGAPSQASIASYDGYDGYSQVA